MIRLWFPWPARVLNPNSHHRHWRHKNEARQAARMLGESVTRAMECDTLPEALLAVRITFYPPNRHRRDLDNLVSSIKPLLDGVFTALGTDDSWIERLLAVRGEVRARGEVLVEIEEAIGDN